MTKLFDFHKYIITNVVSNFLVTKKFPMSKYFRFSMKNFEKIKEVNSTLTSEIYFFNDTKWYSTFENINGKLAWTLFLDGSEK